MRAEPARELGPFPCPYSAECVEGNFSEVGLRPTGVLRSSRRYSEKYPIRGMRGARNWGIMATVEKRWARPREAARKGVGIYAVRVVAQHQAWQHLDEAHRLDDYAGGTDGLVARR